eukprot:IDg19847t1
MISRLPACSKILFVLDFEVELCCSITGDRSWSLYSDLVGRECTRRKAYSVETA